MIQIIQDLWNLCSVSTSVHLNRSFHSLISQRCHSFFTRTYMLHIMVTTLYYAFRQFRFPSILLADPRSGELRMQKLKSHLVRTQSLNNVLPFKPGLGQYIAIHATLTARDFFLASFYPPGPFTCIFSQISPDFSCVGCG